MVMMESYSNVIRITDDQVLNGQHLRVQHTYGTGDVSSGLIQQGGRRGWGRQLQGQHDGVVQLVQQYSDRASPSTYGGGEVLGRGGAAPWLVFLQPSPHPSIYRRRGERGPTL